ncbi:MAG: AraC family transcriptional regulator [Bacteroidetes bacterium]|nr:AraC family transcriptional regulator [Bacteroidota bacterium]
MRHYIEGDCDKYFLYFWRMICISILALKNAVMASITDSAYVFTKVNEFLKEAGKTPLFKIQLVGFTEEVRFNNGPYTIRTDAIFATVRKTDLIIIPSLAGHASSATYINKDCAIWIAEQYKNGSEVASLCTGAFLLAYSGILDGKQCTTHWEYANEFRYFYPSVTLVDEKVITDQDGLYSSGGSTAYWNLLVHLVEKYTNREIAIRTAKYFVVDLDKNNQSAFIIFQGLKDHEDEVVLKAQKFIEQNYAEKITVNQIADRFNVTRRTFERRFKKATRNTVAEYIQRVKVEATKKQLEIGRKSINEIMYAVGYSDIQTFREVFKRITGMTPVDYRGKYNKG